MHSQNYTNCFAPLLFELLSFFVLQGIICSSDMVVPPAVLPANCQQTGTPSGFSVYATMRPGAGGPRSEMIPEFVPPPPPMFESSNNINSGNNHANPERPPGPKPPLPPGKPDKILVVGKGGKAPGKGEKKRESTV
jgi:hypothetical protein